MCVHNSTNCIASVDFLLHSLLPRSLWPHFSRLFSACFATFFLTDKVNVHHFSYNCIDNHTYWFICSAMNRKNGKHCLDTTLYVLLSIQKKWKNISATAFHYLFAFVQPNQMHSIVASTTYSYIYIHWWHIKEKFLTPTAFISYWVNYTVRIIAAC